jgi:hypothetical protein
VINWEADDYCRDRELPMAASTFAIEGRIRDLSSERGRQRATLSIPDVMPSCGSPSDLKKKVGGVCYPSCEGEESLDFREDYYSYSGFTYSEGY